MFSVEDVENNLLNSVVISCCRCLVLLIDFFSPYFPTEISFDLYIRGPR